MRILVGPLLRIWHKVRAFLRNSFWRARLGHLGYRARLYPYAVIHAPRHVLIGSDTVINDFVHIWGAGGVEIGKDVLIAAGVVITSQSHRIDALAQGRLYRDTVDNARVVIDDNVWIGSGAIVLPGVFIGRDSVVAAGSVVTRDVPPGCLVAGVPARLVRRLDREGGGM
jgi:maltose O-acetyltransferase